MPALDARELAAIFLGGALGALARAGRADHLLDDAARAPAHARPHCYGLAAGYAAASVAAGFASASRSGSAPSRSAARATGPDEPRGTLRLASYLERLE